MQKEIIERVKAGDVDAFREVCEEYRKLLYSIVNRYHFECGDFKMCYEDLCQEATIGLFEACQQFDHMRGVKFSTFVYTVVDRKVRRTYKKYKEIYSNEGCSIDSVDLIDHMENFQTRSVAEDPIAYHCENELKQRLDETKRLNKYEKEILKLRIENYSYAEIAGKLNINEKAIDNKMYRLRKKFMDDKKERKQG